MTNRFQSIALCTLLSSAAVAQEAGKHVTFVSCPVLRNTALPCWLGESAGKLYYLGPQGDLGSAFYPPEFGHRMLVEGVIADGSSICGGVVLKPVKVSVLPDQDVSCNITLPAEGYPDPPHVRGTGPSGARGQPYLPPPRPKPPEYSTPYKAQSFAATFNADSDRLWAPGQSAVSNAASYANLAKASKIKVVGYRAAIRLMDGHDFVEDAALPENRAKAVELALRTIGVPSASLDVSWKQSPISAKDMTASLAARHVSIEVTP